MSRSYWLYIIIFAVVLSLPPQGSRAEEQNPPNDKQINIANPFSWVFHSSDEPDQLTQPCKPGENNRNSDLCAQWKAADAARDSARWARYTFWLSIMGAAVGVLTFIVAVAAALFAKSASDHTKNGAEAAWKAVDVTEDMGRRQIRAYVGISKTKIEITPNKLICYVEIKNSGQSPAYKLSHWIKGNADGTCDFSEKDDKPTKQDIGPGQSMYLDIAFDAQFPENSGKGKHIMIDPPVYVWGRADYIDAFNKARYLRYRTETRADLRHGRFCSDTLR